MQHPAKRQRADSAGGAARAARSGDENGSDGEEGPAEQAKAGAARWNSELLAHNAAIKADAIAMQDRRAAFLDEHLEVRLGENGRQASGWAWRGQLAAVVGSY